MEIFNVGIHELSAFKWRDVQRNITDGVSRTPLEKKNFRPENIDESEIFIRELIQNSLDARKMTSQRVEDRGVPRIQLQRAVFGQVLEGWSSGA